MYTIKMLLAAATMTVTMAAGLAGANAAPWDHRLPARHEVMRHARPLVVRERVESTLRLHHFRAFADPVFIRGHYVVRSHDRFGHAVLVEVNPYTGALIGEFRV
jgi:hypothetical protein